MKASNNRELINKFIELYEYDFDLTEERPNVYAHVYGAIKDLCGCSYKEIETEDLAELLDFWGKLDSKDHETLMEAVEEHMTEMESKCCETCGACSKEEEEEGEEDIDLCLSCLSRDDLCECGCEKEEDCCSEDCCSEYCEEEPINIEDMIGYLKPFLKDGADKPALLALTSWLGLKGDE